MRSTFTAGLLTILHLGSAFAHAGSEHSLRVSGDLQPAAQFEIKPEVGGRIKKIHVRPGDQVKSGDLLVEIDNLLVEDNSKLKVLAPTGGTVLTVPIIERQLVFSDGVNSSTLMTIADLSKLIVETHVPQAGVSKLASKQAVRFTADSIQSGQMEATISFIAPVPTVRNSVKGFTVQAVIEKPDPRLHPGMTVELTIPTSTPARTESDGEAHPK